MTFDEVLEILAPVVPLASLVRPGDDRSRMTRDDDDCPCPPQPPQHPGLGRAVLEAVLIAGLATVAGKVGEWVVERLKERAKRKARRKARRRSNGTRSRRPR